MTLGTKIRNQLNNPAHFDVVNQIRAQVSNNLSDKLHHIIELHHTVYGQTWRIAYDKIYEHTMFAKKYLTK